MSKLGGVIPHMEIGEELRIQVPTVHNDNIAFEISLIEQPTCKGADSRSEFIESRGIAGLHFRPPEEVFECFSRHEAMHDFGVALHPEAHAMEANERLSDKIVQRHDGSPSALDSTNAKGTVHG